MCQAYRNDLQREGDEVAPRECKSDDSDIGVDVGLAAVIEEKGVDCGTH